MNSRELNKLLIKAFPNLKEEYIEEVSWQEGDDTGSHTVYGDVFTPYLRNCIEEYKSEKIVQAFKYLERLLNLKDAYADEVVTFSILESVAYLFKEREELRNLLGERTKESMREFL